MFKAPILIKYISKIILAWIALSMINQLYLKIKNQKNQGDQNQNGHIHFIIYMLFKSILLGTTHEAAQKN